MSKKHPRPKGMSDGEWFSRRVQDAYPRYVLGDVVAFYDNGLAIITRSMEAKGEHATAFSVEPVAAPGFTKGCHKIAWHYAGDFKQLVVPSALRRLHAMTQPELKGVLAQVMTPSLGVSKS